MISRSTFFGGPAILLIGLAAAALGADAKEAFVQRIFTGTDQRTLPFRLLKPKDYDAGNKYPLVLFFHGAGERGTDNTIQLVHGMNDFSKEEIRDKYPCFVIAPQCPVGKRWVEVDWTEDAHDFNERPSETMQLVIELLKALPQEFSIDSDRLYVTGLSMGGFGTWDLISRFPEKFAAAAPVCGGADEKLAPKIASVPIWTFHGDKDGVVKPSRSRNMIGALKEAGGKPLYTEYEGVGHDSWVPAYADPKLMEWMFAQKLKRTE